MEAYDDNKDGAIEIRELAQLLPLEESFLLLFRFDNPLDSSVEFMKIWREYDTDNSGFIEADELKNFLRDLMKEANRGAIDGDVDEDKLIEYTDTLLQIFDTNKDGKLQLSEMAKLLPVKENFLCRSNFIGTKLTQQDIETVFSLYDRDNNGTIENEELKGFLKDLLELVKKDYDAQDLEQFQRSILKGCDLNKDGKINKKELTMVLLALAKHAQEEEDSMDEEDKLNNNQVNGANFDNNRNNHSVNKTNNHNHSSKNENVHLNNNVHNNNLKVTQK